MGGRVPLRLTKLSDDLYVYHDDDWGEILLAKAPWWRELPPPPAGRGLYLSLQGNSDGVWHDGIFGRFADGVWTDLVLPGQGFTLEVGRSSLPLQDVEAFWKEEKFTARKQSLILALHKHLGPGFSLPKRIEQGGASEADFVLGLLLLRLAYPERAFALVPRDVRVKRLAQNLNIEALRADAPGAESVLQFPNLGPKEKVIELLRWQQGKSPFIPLHLLTSLVE